MATRYDPANCPCDHPCPRNRDCEACKRYHHGSGSQTACERRAEADD
ncbi:MAG: hypothetical protein ACOCYN_04640 [Planctomycetota bacterium]